MKKNMGTADRLIRAIVAAVIFVLYYNGIISGVWGIVAVVVAIVFLLSSFLGICPLYTVFGWRTCPAEKNPSGSAR